MPRKANRPRKPVSRFNQAAGGGRSANPKSLLPVYTIYLNQSKHIPWGSHTFAHLAAARRAAAGVGSQWIAEVKDSQNRVAGYFAPVAHFGVAELDTVLRQYPRQREHLVNPGKVGAHYRMLELENKVRGEGLDLTPMEAHELRLAYDALQVPPLHRIELGTGRDKRMPEWEVKRSRGMNPFPILNPKAKKGAVKKTRKPSSTGSLPEDYKFKTGDSIHVDEKLQIVGPACCYVAIASPKSSNKKTGNVAVTSTCQLSCPDYCPFFTPWNKRSPGGHGNEGCYGETGQQVNAVTARMNKAGLESGIGPHDIAKAEALAIQLLLEKVLHGKKKPMRLHVVGDARTDAAASELADACRGWPEVWSYTHAWKDVSRSSWGNNISVLASCETPDEVEDAHGRGYATCTVLPYGFKDDVNPFEWNGITIQPCWAISGHRDTCLSCKLCWRAPSLLRQKHTIAFTAHSAAAKKVQEHVLEKLKAAGWDPQGGGKL